MKEKNRGISGAYLFRYTLMMGVLFAVTFFWFLSYGRSFIWGKDGFCQHYTALVYYGEYLRGIVKGLLVEHRLEIPLWDMDIGYGSDILSTLHYYVIGDPLNLLSVLVPSAGMEYLYNGLILFRIYLAGLSFSWFCLHCHRRQGERRLTALAAEGETGWRHQEEGAVLLGSACYCFCGYVLNIAVRHPYFMNPMIYLPMLLLGVDRIYQGKKPVLYILSVALAGISNFYFFYMLGILVVLYAAARYLDFRIPWRELLRWVGRFTVYSLVGIAMSAVILLPVVISIYGTDRMGVEFHIPLLYTDSYYQKLFLQLTGGGKAEHYSYLGYSALGFLALVVLYFRRGENTLLKILFPVMTVFLLFPYIGHIFNGFSYRTNRWIFAYSLLVACMVARAVPIFFTLHLKEKGMLAGVTLLYGMLCLYLSSASWVVSEVLLLAVCCGVICVLGRASGRWRTGILLFLFGGCTFFQAFYLYTPAGENYQNEFIALGEGFHQLVEQAPEAVVCGLMGEGSGCRFDKTRELSGPGRGLPQNNNEAMVINRHGIGYYFSLDNPGVSEFLEEMQLNTTSYHRYSDLDSRNILETLSSVKYVVAKEGQAEAVPSQYQGSQVHLEGGFPVYGAKEALPIGYTYQSYIPRALYDTLSVVEKQQALLQGCVLEDSRFPAGQPEFCHCPVSFRMEAGKGISLEGSQKFSCQPSSSRQQRGMSVEAKQGREGLSPKGSQSSDSQQPGIRVEMEQGSEDLPQKRSKIRVKKKGASVTLHCGKTVPGELYVVFSGLKYQYQDKNQAKLRLRAGGAERVLTLKNNRNNFYAGIDDFLVNLGDFKEPVEEIRLTFPDRGSYSYDSITVVSQPMGKQLAYAGQRGEEVLENITFPTNQIQGEISLSGDRILFLSVPYSTGWRAWVDGESAELKRANTFGMALELSEGKHQVTLAYRTPYLLPGAILSALGCICFFVFFLYNRKEIHRYPGKDKEE